MVKAMITTRIKAVFQAEEGIKTDKEISSTYGFSDRTLRRLKKSYRENGIEGLWPKPTVPKKQRKKTKAGIEDRIIRLKQQYPSWGARRIKHQFDIPVHWRTVHRIIRKHGLLIRIKAKPQPCTRFQRRHVDSMWQCDTFEFRIRGVGKVYVTGFTDDCSRFRIMSKVYLHKGAKEAVNALRWALRKGRIPKEIYLDNGKQFIAKGFKAEAKKYGIKLIFGRPYHPRGRGKIEAYHKVLHRELISLKQFESLRHFRKELWRFDKRYNGWRKQEILGWNVPASVYNDERYFRTGDKILKKRTDVLSTKADRC
jgi:putative transposase